MTEQQPAGDRRDRVQMMSDNLSVVIMESRDNRKHVMMMMMVVTVNEKEFQTAGVITLNL